MVENNELVALAALCGDIPGFERSTVIRREIEVVPSSYPVIIRSFEDKAAQRFNDIGDVLDLGVIFWGNSLELFLRLAILSADILPMMSPRVMFSWVCS
jgi:hypothetical protein